jgi:ATP-binding cassette, subfamily B, bacterial
VSDRPQESPTSQLARLPVGTGNNGSPQASGQSHSTALSDGPITGQTGEPGQTRQTGEPGDLRGSKRLRPLLGLKVYIVRYPRMVAAALLALTVSALVMLVLPLAVRRMIDVGFVGADGTFINQYFLALVAIGLVLAVASASRFYAVNWLGERVVTDLRADVFRHLLALGPSFHETQRTGELMSRLTADTTMLKSASGSSLSQALRNTIMLSGALVMMIITSPQLTLLVLVALAGVVLPLIAAGRSVRARARGAQDSLAEASGYAAENLGAIRTLQASTSEAIVAARFDAAVRRAFDAARARLAARAILTAATIFLIVTSIVGVLWFGASGVVSGTMTGGRLGQFVLYALFAGGAMAELSEVWGELSQAAGAAERLAEILAIKPDITAPADPVPLPEPALGTIQFDTVHFAYPTRAERAALHGISFEVRRGETVALVGPSGAGKSTVLSLILRFYDAQSGSVRVDGVAVTDADPIALRGRMALVPQDVAVFADTIAENIRYGLPDAPLEAVIRAARLAHADDFITALPNGYDSQLGERGVTLSGGQRQRIALARAILRDAPILLLDEATSALDAESEAAVQLALETVMRGRTTLVIAHRLATVQRADRIIVLDDGHIVEEGTHASLVAKGGLYARLAELQFLSASLDPATPASERAARAPRQGTL